MINEWVWLGSNNILFGASLVGQMVMNLLQCRRPRFNPWLGRSPGEGNGYPLQYCLENSMDRGAWQTTVHKDSKELWTLISEFQKISMCHEILFFWLFSSPTHLGISKPFLALGCTKADSRPHLACKPTSGLMILFYFTLKHTFLTNPSHILSHNRSPYWTITPKSVHLKNTSFPKIQINCTKQEAISFSNYFNSKINQGYCSWVSGPQFMYLVKQIYQKTQNLPSSQSSHWVTELQMYLNVFPQTFQALVFWTYKNYLEHFYC